MGNAPFTLAVRLVVHIRGNIVNVMDGDMARAPAEDATYLVAIEAESRVRRLCEYLKAPATMGAVTIGPMLPVFVDLNIFGRGFHGCFFRSARHSVHRQGFI